MLLSAKRRFILIQDIAPYRFRNEFKDTQDVVMQDTDPVFAFEDRTVLCRQNADGTYAFPTVQESLAGGTDPELLLYLFAEELGAERRNYYLYRCHDTQESLSVRGYTYTNISAFRSAGPKNDWFACMSAFHLFCWYKDTRFCGRCGSRMSYYHKERAMICRKCGNIVYPRLNPAVIVGVTKGDSILLTRYAGRAYGGNALVAGFTEIGETLEQTVAREVMEETGIHVKNIRYYGSQPWGLASDILMGFYCDAEDGEDILMDENELAAAKFVRRDALGEENRNVSLTADMIMNFKEKGRLVFQ